MPNLVTTTEKILKKLNEGKDVWVEVPTLYMLSSVKVDGPNHVNLNPDGMVVKLFVNTNTGETKTFIAKWIDSQETKQLTI